MCMLHTNELKLCMLDIYCDTWYQNCILKIVPCESETGPEINCTKDTLLQDFECAEWQISQQVGWPVEQQSHNHRKHTQV